MNLSLYIAGRYLFAKKSHNVINAISAISVVGMAIGSAALVIILSVFNGFDKIIKDNMSDLDPDILICSETGGFFTADSSAFAAIAADQRVATMGCVLEDNVFVRYAERQGIAKAKGVDDIFGQSGNIEGHIVDGSAALHFGDTPRALVGASLASEFGIRARFTDQMELYYPEREGAISIANPLASLHSASLRPGGIFSISASVDENLIIVPIETMSALVNDDSLVSGVEIRLKGNSDREIKEFIRSIDLPQGLKALDRYQQQPSLYRMMRYEKFAIYMILIFVVIIIAFNIFGSLSMLRIEKSADMDTLRAMGADESLVRRVFVFEGWLVSLLGLVIGLATGIAITLLQQHFGIVKMPGSFLMEAYPVVLSLKDILATALGVAAIGLLISEINH